MTEDLQPTPPRTLTPLQIDGIVAHLLYVEESCALIRCALETEEPGRIALNGAINLLDEVIAIAEVLRIKLPGSEDLPSPLNTP